MPSIVEQLDRLAEDTIVIWANTVRSCWNNACAYDGIDPASPAVIFSDDNPVIPYLNKAISSYREAVSNRGALGYEGLVVSAGRAAIPAKTKKGKGSRKGQIGT